MALFVALGATGVLILVGVFCFALGKAAALGDEDMARAAHEEIKRDEW